MNAMNGQGQHLPVAVIGAGPVGLATALDLHRHGIPFVLFDRDTGVCEGSRAIAWARRTLEIFDRLGVGEEVRARGITWQLGKVFWRDSLVYEFDLQPDGDFRFPAFVNLPQYEVERIMLDRLATVQAPAVRWAHRLTGFETSETGTTLHFETPDGPATWTCGTLIAADGTGSSIRKLLGLEFEGRSFEDKFLIADVQMKHEHPTERWFWFDPPFNRGESALLHRQPDNIWRIDLQLGAAADVEAERDPARVRQRIEAMLGRERAFELNWVSVYRFHCRSLGSYRHGNVFFVGDSAHQISPFGGRGGNSGIQDADNLVWKLALTLAGRADDRLLDSYDDERRMAAGENMKITSRSMNFISPRETSAKVFRDAVLELSSEHAFARGFVNSGRLSQPTHLTRSMLNQPDEKDSFAGGVAPGSPCLDAALARPDGSPSWLLGELGACFSLLVFAGDDDALAARVEQEAHAVGARTGLSITPVTVGRTAGAGRLHDARGAAHAKYDAASGTTYLVRPDQHVFARFRGFDAEAVRSVFATVCGQDAAPAGRDRPSGKAQASAATVGASSVPAQHA